MFPNRKVQFLKGDARIIAREENIPFTVSAPAGNVFGPPVYASPVNTYETLTYLLTPFSFSPEIAEM